jgi:hypothetical protein
MLTRRSLFRLAQIRFADTFQNDDLRHNNLINLALWKSRYIWSAIDKSDIVLSLCIEIKKKVLFSRASNFRNLIQLFSTSRKILRASQIINQNIDSMTLSNTELLTSRIFQIFAYWTIEWLNVMLQFNFLNLLQERKKSRLITFVDHALAVITKWRLKIITLKIMKKQSSEHILNKRST